MLASPLLLPRTTELEHIDRQPVGNRAAADPGPERAAVVSLFRSLATPFVENRGQWSLAAKYVARRAGQAAAFERAAIVLDLAPSKDPEARRHTVVRLEFEDVDAGASLQGVGRLAGVRNYFLGSDPASWRTDVPAFSSVEYRGLHPGVDVRVHDGGAARPCDLEYDVVLAPNADLASLAIRCLGVDALDFRDDGTLALVTPAGQVIQSAPVTWQERPDGTRVSVTCRFRRLAADRFGFETTGRDPSLPLCIDPGLDWSTFVGGGQDDVLNAVFVDPSGFVNVTGTTSSTDFPTTAGTFNPTFHGPTDAVVARFDPLQTDAAQLLWATYVGGTGDENGRALFVDAAGIVTFAGETDSTSFPTTKGAYDRFANGAGDLFVVRLDPAQTGSAELLWSTYLGGTGKDEGALGLHGVDANGVVTVFGTTLSTDFPTTAGCFAANAAGGSDAFVARLDPSLSGAAQLLYGSYLGGTADDTGLSMDVDGTGRVILAGKTRSSDLPTTTGAYDTTLAGQTDAFGSLLDLGSNGAADLLYSTYFGGILDETANSVAFDAGGAICLAGPTTSNNLPTTTGAYDTTFNGGGRPSQDGFLARIDPAGNGASDLMYSTYLGGATDQDVVSSIAVNASGEVTLAGTTWSSDFPTTPSAYKNVYVSAGDGFVAKIRCAGNGVADLTYSTYLGASADDLVSADRGVAVDANDFPVVVGKTRSTNYPVTTNAFSTTLAGSYDGFASRLCLASWRSYGAGYAGTLGAPVLAPQSNPILNQNFAIDLSNSLGASTAGLVLVGIAAANSPTTAGGTLLVVATVAIPVTVSAAGTTLSGSLPNDPALCGVSLYFQGLEADAGAPFGISFSAGVRLVLGF